MRTGLKSPLGPLLLLALLLYLPILRFGFTNWDDPAQVLENPLVLEFSLAGVPGVFSTPVVGQYHPLVTVVFGIEHRLFGQSGFFFHLGGLLWHLAVICLLLALLQSLGVGDFFALLAAGTLFVAHPFQAAVLGWVPARKDLICAVFYLSALLVYCRRGPRLGPGRGAVILLLAAAAILAKAVAVTLPLALLGLDLVRGRRDRGRMLAEKIPLLLLGAAFAALAWSLQPSGSGGGKPALAGVFPAGRALLFYCGRGLLPVSLSPLYPEVPGEYSISPGNIARVLAAAGLLLGWFAFCRRARRDPRRRLAGFGAGLALLNFLPVLRLVPFGGQEIVAARFMYLPLAGVALGLGAILEAHPPSRDARAVLGAVFLCLALLNLEYQGSWRDGTTFWEQTIRHFPGWPIAHHQLGNARWRAGDPVGAAAGCARALQLDPGLEKSWIGKALGLWESGRSQEAIPVLEEGIAELERRNLGTADLRRCLADLRRRSELQVAPAARPQQEDGPSQGRNAQDDQDGGQFDPGSRGPGQPQVE